MNSKTAQDYENDLNILYKTFNITLEELSQSYIDFKLSGNSKEYELDKENLEEVKSTIYQYKNNILKNSDAVKKDIIKLNKSITALNKENTILTNRLYNLNNQDSGAIGELKEKKFIYKELYTYNFILFIIILGNITGFVINKYKS